MLDKQTIQTLTKRIVAEGKSFTTNEKEKSLGEYDPIYVKEKIRHHKRRLLLWRISVGINFCTLLFALYLLFNYDALHLNKPVSLAWYKGVTLVLTLLSILGVSIGFVNHAKNISLLRLISYLHENNKDEPITSSNTTSTSQPGFGRSASIPDPKKTTKNAEPTSQTTDTFTEEIKETPKQSTL